jgi:hypothetical protein
MKKILICGDSFGLTDNRYPGLHFSDKIANCAGMDVINFSVGGASNALIAAQFLQALNFKPDFVIFTFTGTERYEYDNQAPMPLQEVTYDTVGQYLKDRYITNCWRSLDHIVQKNIQLDKWRFGVASDSMERLKNYFYISMCIASCQTHRLPFCFSLGGFEHRRDYKELLEQNYIKDLIDENKDRRLNVNLWDYNDRKLMSPWFHVDDDRIQTEFSNECIKFIKEEFC